MKLSKDNSMFRFLLISYLGIVLFILIVIARNGFGLSWLVADDGYGHSFSDHFKHIVYASDL